MEVLDYSRLNLYIAEFDNLLADWQADNAISSIISSFDSIILDIIKLLVYKAKMNFFTIQIIIIL